MRIEEMRQRKKELGYSYKQIADYSGVPLGTVQKVLTGATKAPRYETLQALEAVLGNEDRAEAWQQKLTESRLVRETSAYNAKEDGEYTLTDYYQLPGDERTELIDGYFYNMSAPTTIHQLISSEIWGQLKQYIQNQKGTCIPMLAPVDVQLDCDEKTMVQPDVLVVCDRKKIIRRCIYGAPDLVIEVLSDTTRKKDMGKKLYKYSDAGVREYWLVDPEKKKILVYDLEHEEFPTIYGFSQKVPVAVFEGACMIDFKQIEEYIHFLY